MMRLIIFLCVLAFAVPARAEALQQTYDRAELALANKRYPEAVTLFTEVLQRMTPRQRAALAGANVRMRLGEGLFMISRFEAALDQLQPAAEALSKAGDAEKQTALQARYYMGLAYEGLGEFTAAEKQLEAAYSADPTSNVGKISRLALARVSVFTNPGRARRLIDEEIAAFKPLADPRITGERRGELLAMRGRVDLNEGRYKHAVAWFEKALKSAGGMGTSKVSLADTRIRSDLAIALFLGDEKSRATLLLASTGSARVGDKAPDFPHRSTLTLPDCAPATNVQRDDMVIVELTIRDDGVVSLVRPIYSTRPGMIEASFVREILKWSWSLEELATVEHFWRSAMRIQLRCSNNTERKWAGERFLGELMAGLDAVPASVASAPPGARAHAASTELLRLENAGTTDPRKILPILISMIINGSGDRETIMSLGKRASEAAVGSGLSDRLKAILEIMIFRRTGYYAAATHDAPTPSASWPADVRALLDMELGRRAEAKKRPQQAQRRYEAILASGLPADDPLFQFAALRLASLAYADKDKIRAAQMLDKSGLKPEQCSLLDIGPQMRSQGITADDYPKIAMQYEFDGYIIANADISVNGLAQSPRTVFAFPPFLFNETVDRGMNRIRFKPIYREGVTIGCSGYEQAFRFSIRPL